MPYSNGEAAEPEAAFGLSLRPLVPADLPQVLAIENASFASPWRREHFLHELEHNPWARNHAACRGDDLWGYACVWHLFEELRINNLAVDSRRRTRGVGGWLLRQLMRVAGDAGCTVARLEVRPSNTAALRLYRAHGFEETGKRRGYYQAEGEDALLMEAALVPGRTADS